MNNKTISIKTLVILLLTATALLVSGCAAGAFKSPEQRTPEEDAKPLEQVPVEVESSPSPDQSEILVQTLPPGSKEMEITPPALVTGEVPAEIMQAVMVDLVERTSIKVDDIKILRAEAVVWNDGSLGCPIPGEFYIQMLINGFQVVFEVEGVEYDYRVSDQGSFQLCEGAAMQPVDPPDTDLRNPLVVQAREDLAARLSVPSTEIKLLKIEEVTWRDGSLGCPQPGMRYTQALVNGTLILLVHDGNIYQYHSGMGSPPFLCEDPPKNMEEVIISEEDPPGLSDQ